MQDSTTMAGAASAADPGPARLLQALAPNSIRRPRISPVYLVSLWLVTALCLLVPLIYFGLIAGIVWLEYLFYTEWGLSDWAGHMPAKATILVFLLYLVPGIFGGVLVLFLLKPLFAPRSPPPVTYPIDAAKESEFVAAVRALCKAMNIRPPAQIRLSNDVNASVHFERGLLGLFTGRKVLTIGLPIVAGLNARQLVGVLAHEFGHFAQSGGMRCSFLINTVNRWLHSRAYVEDAWDRILRETIEEEEEFLPKVLPSLLLACLSCTRLLMRGLFVLSFRMSRRLSQQMEFDADRYGATVAGSDTIREISLRVRGLIVAWHQSRMKNAAAWQEGRLVDDLADAVRLRLQSFDPREWDGIALELQGAHTTEYWDTHPADQERIENAERLRAPGLFPDDRPAAGLFSDFGVLSRRITMLYYKDAQFPVSPSRMIDAQKLWGMHRIDDTLKDAWMRYSNGLLSDVMPLRPHEIADPAVAAIGWQQSVDELRRLGPEVQGLWARMGKRRDRADSLAFWLLLIEHGIDFSLPDGQDYDGGAIRQDYLDCLSERDADAKLALRVLALFGRRMQCAVDAAPDDASAVATWALLQRLSVLWPKVRALEVSRRSLARMIQGLPPEDETLASLAKRLVEVHRDQAMALLATMDEVVLDDAPLGKQLMERCGHLSATRDDPFRFLFATGPLETGFMHAYRVTLAAMVDIADRIERDRGITPIKIVIKPRDAVTS